MVDKLWGDGDAATDRRTFAQRKRARVEEVFAQAAPRYDLMNDLMTLGAHRLWKQWTLETAALRPDSQVLDLACGTMDLSIAAARRCRQGRIVAVDASPDMLAIGRDRALDAGIVGRIDTVRADAENLPFEAGTFDRVLIGFGVRNFSDRMEALRECRRVLRPHGRLVVLELSTPEQPLVAACYEQVSRALLPALGRLVTGRGDSYQYLHDSVRHHPAPAELASEILQCGFRACDYRKLAGGVATIHSARAAL